MHCVDAGGTITSTASGGYGCSTSKGKVDCTSAGISKREFANRKHLSAIGTGAQKTFANRKHLSIRPSTYTAGVPMRITMWKAGYLVLPSSTRNVLPGPVKYSNDHEARRIAVNIARLPERLLKS